MKTGRFYKKTYMISIVQNNTEIAAFSFSTPAQEENFNYPQRVYETKTFGGVIFDKYGNDSVKVHISGSTINQELRTVYNGLNGNKVLTGKEEIFLLQEIISQNNKNILNLGKQKITLYDLSSTKYWEGVITELDIKRNKDNPLAYNYSFNFLGKSEGEILSISGTIGSIVSWVRKASEFLRKGSDWLAGGLSYLRKAKDLIASLNYAIDSFESELLRYSEIIGGYISETVDIIDETLYLGENLVSSALRIVSDTGVNLYNSAANVNNCVKRVKNFIDSLSEKDFPQDLLESYSKTWDEIKDVFNIIAGNMEEESTSVVTSVKDSLQKVDFAIIPGGENSNDEVVVTYGFQTKIATDGDTWDRLAEQYFGDASYSNLLASYNSALGVNEIKAGTKVFIPLLEYSEITNKDNKIYSSVDDKDNYGKDIYIKNKDFGITQNDFMIIEGAECLGQSITNRLTTVIGGRVRLNTYGLKNQVGEPVLIESYIMASLYQTLNQEPRIKTIESVKFNGVGENLNIEVVYTDINGTKQIYGGSF